MKPQPTRPLWHSANPHQAFVDTVSGFLQYLVELAVVDSRCHRVLVAHNSVLDFWFHHHQCELYIDGQTYDTTVSVSTEDKTDHIEGLSTNLLVKGCKQLAVLFIVVHCDGY